MTKYLNEYLMLRSAGSASILLAFCIVLAILTAPDDGHPSM